jgi:hypothetical protein
MEAERRVCPGLAALELSCRALERWSKKVEVFAYFNNDWEGTRSTTPTSCRLPS